jgi:glycerol kinase
MKKYVVALDASTASVRAILFDHDGRIVADSATEFTQYYPQSGWVEHDPLEILNKQLEMLRTCVNKAKIEPSQIAAIGITNQRETTVIWDRISGMPIYKAIVWQDRRTAEVCQDLKAQGFEEYVKENTGLVLDSYFSGTKIAWILDHVEGARTRAERGELLFGTIDTWLIWNLTGGKAHVTDVSNASRTLLFNIKTFAWDEKLLTKLRVPSSVLPEVRKSSEIYGYTTSSVFGEVQIPIAASAGDQQASLFGQACFTSGMVKCTYGTGASLMMNTGSEPIFSKNGLLTTVACQVGDERQYAIEGLIFVSAQVVKWLRDELQLIQSADETESAANEVENNDGVYLVPAFTGLAVPYWDQFARGTLIGMTLRTGRSYVIRAALESICYQIKDCIDAMRIDSKIDIREIRVDGGASKNNFVMQFQADLLRVPVARPLVVESTARGAAFLAGLAVGFWESKAELQDSFALESKFEPVMTEAIAVKNYEGWKKAVSRSRDWADSN